MNKKTLPLVLIAGVLIIGLLVLFFRPQKSLTAPVANQLNTIAKVEPSKSIKAYSDPSGFSFNYPDNLSLGNNELKDNNTYAELQLTAKEVNGNLSLHIADSKFKSISDWVKTASPSSTPKDVSLGNLKAVEITKDNKILLGALDSGVFFNIEVNFAENKDFWMNVYSSVVKDFSFAPPADTQTSQGSGSSDDVSFEGEEVVE